LRAEHSDLLGAGTGFALYRAAVLAAREESST
jgi:hypothetical protein